MHAFISDPRVQLVGLVFTIVSVPMAILLFVWSLKRKRPAYAVTTSTIVVNAIPGLNLRYRGQDIERLSMSRLYFWNAGNEAIEWNDVAPRDPLRVVIGAGITPFGVTRVLQSNVSNDFAASPAIENGPEGSCINITFHHFNRNEGCVIELIHDGPDSANVQIAGQFVGTELSFGLPPKFGAIPELRPTHLPSSFLKWLYSKFVQWTVEMAAVLGFGLFLIFRPGSEWYEMLFGLCLVAVSSVFLSRFLKVLLLPRVPRALGKMV